MKTKGFCHQCDRPTEITSTGDLAQYMGDLLSCPCGDSYVVPRDVAGEWHLFAIADLLTPCLEAEGDDEYTHYIERIAEKIRHQPDDSDVPEGLVDALASYRD